jgi:hypothetical protein
MLDLHSGLVASRQASDGTTIASVTLTAPDSTEHPGRRWAIGGIAASYSGAAAAGYIKVTDGGTTVFEVDFITSGGDIALVDFPEPLKFKPNSAVVISMGNGTATTVVSKLSVLGSKLVA